MVTLEGVADFLKRADNMYNYCIESGIPKEEARQVLPNAKAVNLMWTVNARSLVNSLNMLVPTVKCSVVALKVT